MRDIRLLESCGCQNLVLSRLLSNLACLYETWGRGALQVENLRRRALDLTASELGPEHPEVGIVMSDLGASLEARNRVAEAQALFERAVPFLEKSPEVESPGMARILAYRGGLRSRAGRYPEAVEDLTRALGLFEKANGPNHPLLVGPLLGLGWVYLHQNRSTMAEKPHTPGGNDCRDGLRTGT